MKRKQAKAKREYLLLLLEGGGTIEADKMGRLPCLDLIPVEHVDEHIAVMHVQKFHGDYALFGRRKGKPWKLVEVGCR